MYFLVCLFFQNVFAAFHRVSLVCLLTIHHSCKIPFLYKKGL
nr:MAG TPA: hypothetical protein [Caudoviricetes sp.]